MKPDNKKCANCGFDKELIIKLLTELHDELVIDTYGF